MDRLCLFISIRRGLLRSARSNGMGSRRPESVGASSEFTHAFLLSFWLIGCMRPALMRRVMKSDKSYDGGIAIAKALGIIFVVIGHCVAVPYHGGDSVWQTYISQYIYLFHMPLFFFLSGYFFKFAYIDSKRIFVKKKIDGLWKPFVKWGLLFVLLHNAFCFFGLYGEFHGPAPTQYSCKQLLYNCAMMLTMRGGDQLIGGFWFIPVLFRSAICAMLALWIVRAAFDVVVVYT